MALSAKDHARIALLRVLGAVSVSRGGSYPCKGVITVPDDCLDGKPYRATVWQYPDGGTEVRVTSLPAAAIGEHRVDVESGYSRFMPSGVEFDPDHEKAYALAEIRDRFTNEVRGWVYDERACPATLAVEQVFREHINAARNARRAASKARRLARANRFVYMATLTLPGRVGKDRMTVTQLWRRFCKRDGVRFFHRVHGGWLAFPEEHPTSPGTFHLHILHANRIDAVRLRVGWTAFLKRCGYVLPSGTRFVRVHCKYWGSAHKAARYAAKYLAKGFGVGRARILGQHRYLSSQGLVDCSVRVEREDLRLVVSRNGALAAWLPHGGIEKASDGTDAVWWSWCAVEPLSRQKGF